MQKFPMIVCHAIVRWARDNQTLQLQLAAKTIRASTSVSTNALVGCSNELALAWQRPLQSAAKVIQNDGIDQQEHARDDDGTSTGANCFFVY